MRFLLRDTSSYLSLVVEPFSKKTRPLAGLCLFSFLPSSLQGRFSRQLPQSFAEQRMPLPAHQFADAANPKSNPRSRMISKTEYELTDSCCSFAIVVQFSSHTTNV
jgi:hypothetical protein